MNAGVTLHGLDGSNPLAFLAALGTLRTAAALWHSSPVCMAWVEGGGAWRPAIYGTEAATPGEFAARLHRSLERNPDQHPCAFMKGVFNAKQPEIRLLVASAASQAPPSEPSLAYLAALVSDASADPSATSQLQTARRDYFWGNIENVIVHTTEHQITRALLAPWDYADPLAGQSFHLDPAEDRRHAWQWHEPTKDPTKKEMGGMLGANRLALESFPFFPSLAKGTKLQTLGFTGSRPDDTRWTWPIWSKPLNQDVVASLLGLRELQQESPDAAALRQRGVAAAYRCRRILVNKTPNLTYAVAV